MSPIYGYSFFERNLIKSTIAFSSDEELASDVIYVMIDPNVPALYIKGLLVGIVYYSTNIPSNITLTYSKEL